MTHVIQLAGATLLHFLWQGTLIGLATLVLLRLLRTSSARLRYTVSCCSLGAMLLAPPITAWTLAAGAPAVEGRPPLRITKFLRVAPEGPTAHDTYFFIRARRHPGSAPAPSDATLGATPTAWMSVLVGAWMCGVCALLLRLAGGWWRVQRLQAGARALAPSVWQPVCDRMARHLGLTRAVRVVDASFVDGPMVVGWLRPVVLLPVAALAGLTPAQVEAILAHELAHVRRHDAVVNICQSVAETLLFYHPAVWWVSARIRTEREHCCDDIALAATGDAYGYAAALAELEGWRAQPPSLSLAATGGSLLARVSRLLGAPERPVRGGAVTTVSLGLALTVLAGAWGVAGVALARQPLAAVVQRVEARSTPAWRMVFAHPGGQMMIRGFTARDLVRYAYQLPTSQVIGGPAWLDQDSFELTTSVDHVPADEETPELIRSLLEDRFGLVVHRSTTAVPVLALEVARPDGALGPNLRPAAADCVDQQAWVASGAPRLAIRGQERPPNGGQERLPNGGQELMFCGVWDSDGTQQRVRRVTMADFAASLRNRFDRVLPLEAVNRTGLEGAYDITLDYFRPAAKAFAEAPSMRVPLRLAGFQAFPEVLESQLGLRLVPATADASALVIDTMRRPLEGLTPP